MQTRTVTANDLPLLPSLVDWQSRDSQTIAERRLEFEDLVTRLLPSFRRFAMRMLRNADDAEDAVQDALLSAFKNIARFEGRAQMSTWLRAIITNAARAELRRRHRCCFIGLEEGSEEQHLPLSQILAEPGATPEESLEQRELSELAAKLIAALPDSQRSALWLRCDDLSIEETAEALGVPVGTVKARLSRGRARVAQRFLKATSAKNRTLNSHAKTSGNPFPREGMNRTNRVGRMLAHTKAT